MLSVRSGLGFLAQSPRIAALLELGDDVIGDGIAFSFRQASFQSSHDLGGAAERESQAVAKDVTPNVMGR